MATKDPNRLFDLLDAIQKNMESVVEDAKTLATEAGSFNGELNRVVKEWVTKLYVPAMQKLISDENTPGSVIGLQKFLGSIPLAMVREQPSAEDVPSITPENVDLAEPAGIPGSEVTSPVDNLPQNASYAQPASSAQPVVESKKSVRNKLFEKYLVVRASNIKSALSEDATNLKDAVVAEFDTEDQAAAKAAALNETITPEEKEFLGTEYKVVASEKEDK